MTIDNTLTKLNEMRMSAMAETFREQLRDPEYQELSFEDRFGLLVDIEWSRRQNNKLNRLIKQAEFRETQACLYFSIAYLYHGNISNSSFSQ